MIRICIAGATGWTGSALVAAIWKSDRFALSSAVTRTTAGKDIGLVLGNQARGLIISRTVAEALASPAEVFIDYSHPTVVKENVLTALRLGVPVVIGTSGLTTSDFAEIQRVAEAQGLGVIAAGNFSITAALAKHCALIAARVPSSPRNP